jgi:hypothetical protein
MAKAVYQRAGGTSKGLSQSKFKDAQDKIDDALDRLAADGVIGGDTAPTVIVVRDLSKKDPISSAEFLQYFRGRASERDLEIRRKLVDAAVGQAGAAAAAANAMRQQALAQQAAAQAQQAAAQAQQAQFDADRDRDTNNGSQAAINQLQAQNAELEMQLRAMELNWYQQHKAPIDVPHTGGGANQPRTVGGGAGAVTRPVVTAPGNPKTPTNPGLTGPVNSGPAHPSAAGPAHSGNSSSNDRSSSSDRREASSSRDKNSK